MSGFPIAVVVAHPDDEVLWLSSMLGEADRIVFCFGAPFGNPKMAGNRKRAVAALALPGLIDLAIPESGAGFAFDPSTPVQTAAGLAIADPAADARYQANYLTLLAALRPLLAGYGHVHTHNPWGEYGHAEHVQVYRAVVTLQVEFGFTIGFSNYVAARSWPLARQIAPQPGWTQRRQATPDFTTARRLMVVYRRHGAWTWTRWHRWPDVETIYAQPPASVAATRQSFAGETLLDVAGLRWWPPPWRRAGRHLD